MISRIRDRDTFSALAEAPSFRAGPLRVRYVPSDRRHADDSDHPGAQARIAFAVPGRVGSAVVRNRIRRRLRAAASAVELPAGAYLVRGDRNVLTCGFAQLTEAFEALAEQVTS